MTKHGEEKCCDLVQSSYMDKSMDVNFKYINYCVIFQATTVITFP